MEPEPVAQLPVPSGYWLVGADGGIFNYGEADFHGSMGGERINEPVVGIAATVSGGGYWEVALDGGIFSFGDAEFHQSMGGKYLLEPMVGIAPTPTGGGYWTVASDGGVFAFGDAPFYGSMGGTPLNQPVVGIVPTPTGEGYWLVAEDGGVFAFGDAPFAGSLGGDPLDEPIVGLAASGGGYVTVTALGRIDAFGAPEVAGVDADDLDSPIMTVANDANSEGFWVTEADGTVHALEGAHHWGDASDVPLNAPIMAMASVAPDSEGPTVVGEHAEGGAMSVTFQANEPLDPDSIDLADVTTDSAAAITGVELGGDGGTITVTFGAHLALDDTVTLAAGSVTDLAGNAGPVADVVVTVSDLTGPTVVVAAFEGPTATMVLSEPIDPGSLGVEDIAETSAAAITSVAVPSSMGNSVVVTFDAPLADGDTVTLLAGSVTDLSGNAGPSADVTATAPDRTAPTLEAGTVDGATVTFLANEPLDPDTVTLADVQSTSLTAIQSVALDDDGTTVVVTFAGPVADGDAIGVPALSVADVAGNVGPVQPVVLLVPDRTAPAISLGVVDGDEVTFVAAEDLDPDSVALGDVTTTSAAAITSVTLEDDDNTITVTFDAPLADADTVTLTAGSVTDEAGNAGPATAVVATVSLDSGPTIVSATATDNGDGEVSPAGGPILTNDSWILTFSAPVTEVSAEVAEFVIVDADGTSGTFICNSGGCTLSSDGLTLSISVQGDPAPGAPGLVPGLAYPVTIVGFSSGAAPVDADGTPVNLLDSDNIIEASTVIIPG